MRASRRRSAALAAVLLLSVAGSAHGVTARTRTFQSRFRTEQGKEWQVHLDHDSGRPYFFDKETGTSTWDDPRTTPNGDRGDDASSRSGGLLGSLFEPGEVKFTGGGLGGKSRRSSKRAAREAEETRSWFGLFSAPRGASDDDYGEIDADQRRWAGGWSEPSSAKRRRVGKNGDGAKRTEAGYDETTGWMRLDDDDDATTAFGRTSSSPRRPRGRSFFFARGVVAVALVSFFTSVVALCGSAVARVADRAGKGGVGYSRRDATFFGETSRELRFAVAKSSRRTRARLERSFAHAQTVLMETFVAVAEMRLGRAAAALAAGARKIETSASFASLAQVCVLSHLLYESAEQVARFLEIHFELELESPDPSRRAGSPSPPSGPSSSIDHEFLAGIPWLALVSAALVTLALHGVAPRRCVALALAQDAAFGPTLGAARASARACLFPFRTGDKLSEVGAVGDALLLALKRLACWTCTFVVLSRLRRRERTRVRRKVSTGSLDGSFLASDDDDDDDDEDEDDDDGDVVVSRARHRSPKAATAGRIVKTQSRGASAALLASRALVAATFVAACAARVYEPDGVSRDDTVMSDALVFVKLVLAVPLAAGYKVETTSRAAAACVALEAFFLFDLRDARRRAHVAADVACAGGLVLVRAMGGGRYAADARGASKKRE